MTPVTDLHSLHKKYVTLYRYIDIFERDLPPPRLKRPLVYPPLDRLHNCDYTLINAYCNQIFAGINIRAQNNNLNSVKYERSTVNSD
ncbi:unknown [Choristoneura occidentalis granulovirus]|uniref:Uncharacterized protein n=1 Tax=Choristoneura occidentalis granulovirus TaxID=364745 RepID=Q1A4N4_9BBAC|nr:unknown [Choristoneura fumiferana granulovirus]ABC61196.1 unknown [Choristoneura fumiferana granulovirus]